MAGDSQRWARKTSQLAERQHGHVTRRQLLELSVPAPQIDNWIRAGRLLRVHQGVYALGYLRVEPVALAMAAVLACGSDALLGGDSTLALHGLRRWPVIPEVLVTGDRRRPGIRVRRTTTLKPAEPTMWLGVPTTRVARAIADMSARLTERQRTRLVNDARLAHHLSIDEQRALLGHERNPTRSGGEDAVQRWVERHDLPQPRVNVIVNGHEVDAHWPQAAVILQLDHLATHSDPHTFKSDRDIDRHQLDHGEITVRLTADDLTDTEADRVRRLLRARWRDPPGSSR